jgi:hypothetical protein
LRAGEVEGSRFCLFRFKPVGLRSKKAKRSGASAFSELLSGALRN